MSTASPGISAISMLTTMCIGCISLPAMEGQLVMVFPQLDLVVNYNGGAYGEGEKFRRWQVSLVS